MSHAGRSAPFLRAEFERTVLPHLEALSRLARYLMHGHQADAEDLVQDAVLRAFNAFPRFQAGTNLRAWLFRILRNTYVDHLRRHGRESQLIDREAEAPEPGLAVEEFQAQARRECSAADLEAALDQLPAELRMVLLLVDGEGMRYDQVAEVVDCPGGTVRSRLHRARGLLRQELLALWRGGGFREATDDTGPGAVGPQRTLKKENYRMRTVHLKVPTIKCQGCVETIRTALSRHPGVRLVEGDPIRKEIGVTLWPLFSAGSS